MRFALVLPLFLSLLTGCWLAIPTEPLPVHYTPEHCIDVNHRRNGGPYQRNGESLSSWGLERELRPDARGLASLRLTRAGSAFGVIGAVLLLTSAGLALGSTMANAKGEIPRWAGQTALVLSLDGIAAESAAIPMTIVADTKIASLVSDYNREGHCPQ